jgi:outer membrane protein assembly factor BamA
VEFIGNSKLDTTALQEKIDLKLGSVYNPVDVERAKEKIKDAYEDEATSRCRSARPSRSSGTAT